MSCPACLGQVTSAICTCAEFDCEPDVPVTPATPFGFACDDVAAGVSCRQYEQVKVLRAENKRLLVQLAALAAQLAAVECREPCCDPDRKWLGVIADAIERNEVPRLRVAIREANGR